MNLSKRADAHIASRIASGSPLPEGVSFMVRLAFLALALVAFAGDAYGFGRRGGRSCGRGSSAGRSAGCTAGCSAGGTFIVQGAAYAPGGCASCGPAAGVPLYAWPAAGCPGGFCPAPAAGMYAPAPAVYTV